MLEFVVHSSWFAGEKFCTFCNERFGFLARWTESNGQLGRTGYLNVTSALISPCAACWGPQMKPPGFRIPVLPVHVFVLIFVLKLDNGAR